VSKVGTAVVQLYREARRRKVFRTAALYVVGAWLALQVANVVFPGFAIPDAAIRALVWAAVAGFPIALVFGWLFEIGAGGIRRTLPVDSADLHQSPPLARRDYLILAAFAAIAAVLVVRAVQEIRETPLADSAPAAAGNRARWRRATAEFDRGAPLCQHQQRSRQRLLLRRHRRGDPQRAVGVQGLAVIGRTSSFAFKGSDAGIDRISAVLGVSHVLQGSVRKAGDRLRISAQLLDHTGRQLWTETFDRELANVFDIQEEIAQAVATTAASRVVSRPAVRYHPNLEAYDHYLAGRELLHRRELVSARQELQRAIDLDPAFAEAHAEWAISRLIGDPSAEDLEAGRAAIERALELQPKLLRAQAARGFLLTMSRPPDWEGAETILRGVLEQDPNMSDALLWLSNALGAQGRSNEALEILQRGARIDPLHPSIANSLAGELWQRGKVEQAIDHLKRQLEQPNPAAAPYYVLSDIYLLMGRLVDLHAVARRQSLQLVGDHELLAMSYALLGNWSAAQYWQERTPRDFPKSGSLVRRLGGTRVARPDRGSGPQIPGGPGCAADRHRPGGSGVPGGVWRTARSCGPARRGDCGAGAGGWPGSGPAPVELDAGARRTARARVGLPEFGCRRQSRNAALGALA
jgi:tetratricopeptide (TPR) repeat protein